MLWSNEKHVYEEQQLQRFVIPSQPLLSERNQGKLSRINRMSPMQRSLRVREHSHASVVFQPKTAKIVIGIPSTWVLGSDAWRTLKWDHFRISARKAFLKVRRNVANHGGIVASFSSVNSNFRNELLRETILPPAEIVSLLVLQ